MRSTILIVIVALTVAGCGGGSETASGADQEAASNDTPVASTEPVAAPSGGGSAYCRAVVRAVEDAAARVEEDETQLGDLYTFMLDIFGELADDAPNELESDFSVVKDALERYAEWAEDPLQPEPLDEAEQAAFEAANDRINDYTSEECGIDMSDDEEVIVGSGEDITGTPAGESAATQTVTVGGQTYEESLSSIYEVSCDLYGDLETGSIGIYLDGTDFQSSISSYDTGVEPGSYQGSIWVFASDPALDELLWDLQEIDGTFILDHTEAVSDDEWLFEGSFSAAVADPEASIDATFSCVGLIGY